MSEPQERCQRFCVTLRGRELGEATDDEAWVKTQELGFLVGVMFDATANHK